jgi:threonine/homoserine/homoserine lactone efflux protein
MLIFLLRGAGFGLAAAAQPGPFQAYIISQALEQGWRRTLPSAFAPLISDGPIILLMLVVLTRVPVRLVQLLHLASGVFILYLAWGALRSWLQFNVATLTHGTTQRQSVAKAAVMNALSPGPYIFWSLVTGPVLLAAWQESPGSGLAFLCGFYAAMIGCLALVIILFGTARRLGSTVTRALLGLSIIALTGFGLYQLRLGLSALLRGA